MKEVRVNLGERSYSIVIEPSSIQNLGEMIKDKKLGTQAVVISDETVAEFYGQEVLESLQSRSISADLITVPAGEDSKSFEQTNELYTRLIQSNLKRDGMIVALGGGVIGDLAGFAAATYLRGVSLIQVPTTLLAQVDSSVGGKVGINHPMGKNLIGSFHQPCFVLIDPEVLKTLDKREIWAGMGEVVKYGLIWSENFFSGLEKNLDDLAALSSIDSVSEMIEFCCRVKADVVEKDEKEGGLRRILNFGHTLGHALEAATRFDYFRHGEAVVHGMEWSCWVSRRLNWLSENELERAESLLNLFPVPPIPENISTADLESLTRIDKKQSAEGLNLVLLDGIGKTKIEKVKTIHRWIEEWLDHVRK